MTDRDDIAARALDALGPQERRRFDAAADDATLAELASMQEAAAALSEPVAAEPPAALRASILAQIATTEQLSPEQIAAEEAPNVTRMERRRSQEPADDDRELELVGGGSTIEGPRSLEARRRWFRRPASLLAAAAAAVVLLVGGIGIGQAIRTPDPVSTLVHAADVRTQTASLPDGARATLLWSLEQGDAALVVEGLAALDADETYQAWFMPAEGDPIPAGTFAGGDGSVVHALDGEMHEGEGVAVTVEPEGGSEQPTSQPILVMAT